MAQQFKKKRDTSWEKVSGWYGRVVENKDSYQKTVLLPNIEKILSLKGQESVLDIGSGTGFFTQHFAKKAKHVIGVEPSVSMVTKAKSSKIKNLEFIVGDAQRLSEKLQGFDVATMIMMIQNVEEMDAAFRSARCALKEGGRLLIVMNHPVIRIPRQSSWEWDEQKKTQYRRIDSYMTEQKIPIQMHPGKSSTQVTWSFHRPLSSYVLSLKNAGFSILNIEEWCSPKVSDSGPRAKAENRARNEMPLFMAILAQTKLDQEVRSSTTSDSRWGVRGKKL